VLLLFATELAEMCALLTGARLRARASGGCLPEAASVQRIAFAANGAVGRWLALRERPDLVNCPL